MYTYEVKYGKHARIQKVLSEGVQLRQRLFIYFVLLFLV